jgi:hypothetical protein
MASNPPHGAGWLSTQIRAQMLEATTGIEPV